jgi:hypothetical protein
VGRRRAGQAALPIGVLGAKDREKAPFCCNWRGFRKVDLDPTLGTAYICPPAVAARMEVQERLALKIERAAAPIIDADPRSDLAQHVLDVTEAGGVNTAQVRLLRSWRDVRGLAGRVIVTIIGAGPWLAPAGHGSGSARLYDSASSILLVASVLLRVKAQACRKTHRQCDDGRGRRRSGRTTVRL